MFTLIIPHFMRPSHAAIRSLNTPILNQMLRFAHFQAAPQSTEQLYMQHLCNQLILDNNYAYASPMSQQMGMNQITAQHGHSLAITPDEAEHFCQSLNDLYGEDAIFTPLRPDLWRVQLPQAVDWQVDSIFNINNVLQADNAPAQYLQLSTEIQMCLHTHPINQSRKHCPINHLHLWQAPKNAFRQPEYTAIATLSAWQQQSSLKCHTPQNWQNWLDFCEAGQLDLATTAWFDETFLYSDEEIAYRETIEQWDKHMAAHLQNALQSGQLAAFQLICEQGVCEFHAPNVWAFWKRARSFDGVQWS